MKPVIGTRLLGIVLVLMLSIPVLTISDVGSVRASVVGPLEIASSSCSNISVRFYYDGLESRDLYIPSLKKDQFRLHVQNISCKTGNCVDRGANYFLAETWQDVPDGFGMIGMSASWSPQWEGNGIEVTVGQYNVNHSPATLVGRELRFVYDCSGGAAPSSGCSACGSYTPPPAPAPVSYTPPVSTNVAFSFQCTSTGIMVLANGTPVIQAAFNQIAGPLTLAITTQQNQPIAMGETLSLWALKSNELQVHMNANPDQTKLVVSSGICGPITLGQPAVQVQTVYVPVQVVAPTTQTGRYVHIVQPGENLYRISLRYGTTVQAIAAANGIVNVNLIYAGQQLVIP
jgi:LysM repeat protein